MSNKEVVSLAQAQSIDLQQDCELWLQTSSSPFTVDCSMQTDVDMELYKHSVASDQSS